MATPWGWKGIERGRKKRKKVNPETDITNQIRGLLKIMRIPHRKHWGGPMSPKGIPDIIGTLPGPSVTIEDGKVTRHHPAGRAFWCEIKVPGKKPTPEQYEFLDEMLAAGAASFWVDKPQDVIKELAAIRFEPAVRIQTQFNGQIPADHLPTHKPDGSGNSGRFRPAQSKIDQPSPEAPETTSTEQPHE